MREALHETEPATRVVLSYPEGFSERARERVGKAHYRNYLRRARKRVAAGDEWQEFTDVGCCGSQVHVTFRVEAVEGGERLTGDTEIEFTTREGEADGGWRVQNELD
jgi:hypothetical protein